MKLLFIPILMYDGIDTGALIGGTSQLASTALGAMATSSINKRAEQYNWKMFDAQNRENIALSDRQNNYNTPANQMQRFKDAGLNPNLIYGQGNPGNSTPVSSASGLSYNPKAPDYSGIAQGMGNAMSIHLQQKQLDNMDAQRLLINAQTNATNVGAEKTAAEIPGVGISQNSAQFDLDMKRSLQEITKAQSYADLQRTLAGVQNTLTDTQTKQIMQAPNLAAAVAGIIRTNAGTNQTLAETQATEARIKGILSDNQVKAAEARLAQFNIFRSDPEWIRAAILLTQGQKTNPTNVIKNPYNPTTKGAYGAPSVQDMLDSENGNGGGDPSVK